MKGFSHNRSVTHHLFWKLQSISHSPGLRVLMLGSTQWFPSAPLHNVGLRSYFKCKHHELISVWNVCWPCPKWHTWCGVALCIHEIHKIVDCPICHVRFEKGALLKPFVNLYVIHSGILPNNPCKGQWGLMLSFGTRPLFLELQAWFVPFSFDGEFCSGIISIDWQ